MNSQNSKNSDRFEYLTKIISDDEARIFQASKTLTDEIKVRTILDPEGLHEECRRGFLKMKIINDYEFSIFENPNPRGNPLCRLGLNKHNGEVLISNSENARFAARNRLIEIIKANTDFDYFFTGTFNPKKWNRKNFSELKGSFTRWLRRRGIKYILIPEPHKDGSIHFHGFFNKTIEPYLAEFDLSQKLPKRITDGIKDGRKIYNCPDYAKMFGWVSIEKIRSLEACAVYVSKYVSKSFDNDEARFSYHRYFCSIGLKRPFNDVPTLENTEGFEPVRFSSKIVKATYKKQNPSEFLNRSADRLSPQWLTTSVGGAKNLIFSGGARSAHLTAGGTVEPHPLQQ